MIFFVTSLVALVFGAGDQYLGSLRPTGLSFELHLRAGQDPDAMKAFPSLVCVEVRGFEPLTSAVRRPLLPDLPEGTDA